MISEAVTRLYRVLKKIQRPDGTTHKRAYYVKKASPGDVYAQRNIAPQQAPQVYTDDPGNQNVDQEADLNNGMVDTAALEQKYAHRIVIEPLVRPWVLAGETKAAEKDPVPAEIRKRFDPENRALRFRSAIDLNIPLFTLKPGQDLIWGATDVDLLNRMRSGMVVGIRPSQADGHPSVVKIESPDGSIERAYVRFEGMIEDKVYDLYGDMYDLYEDRGSCSRRAAAAYEVAKASGFDDLVPPTVYRVNEHQGLEPMLSTIAIETMADAINKPKTAIPKMIGDSAAFELWLENTTSFCEYPPFVEVLADSDLMNNFYDNFPDLRAKLLRGAVYDFLVWNGSRTWMDMTVCPNPQHPLHLIRNNLVLPNPIAQATAYLDYQSDYANGCASNAQYMPMLWSDLVMTAALRGYEEEADIYDDIGWNCSKRIQGETATDLVRSLNDHRIGALAICGLLVRVAFLRYGAKQVMRNPLLVPQYFASVLTSQAFDPGFDIDLNEMVESIDKVMKIGFAYDFSFMDTLLGNNQ